MKTAPIQLPRTPPKADGVDKAPAPAAAVVSAPTTTVVSAQTSTFDQTGPAVVAEAPAAAAFTEAAKASRAIGWTAVGDAGTPVRAAQAELRHFAKLALEGGLRPAMLRVAPRAEGAPESQFLTVKGDDGQARVAWLVRTADGTMPRGLEALAGELGVKDLGTTSARGIEGARPIAQVTDVSPKAAFGRAMKLADQLFRAAGGDPTNPDFQLFRYTIARYALNATSPQALAYLAEQYQGDTKGLVATGQVPARWVEKLERSFTELYTNEDAMKWLRQMSAKLPEAMKFIDEANVNGAPVTFYTAGSTTKARWTAQSDLDLLVDTPDKELEQKILKGPHGFYGGANKDEFAILNASFYWDRGPFFGEPVELAKGTAAMTPEVVEQVFKRTAKDAWGVEIESDAAATRVTVTPEAAEQFVRESPSVSEVLYDYSRPTRAQLDTKWVTEHWDAVVVDAPELQYFSRQRLVDEGNALVKALLPAALSEANVARFFKAEGLPLPAPGADLAALIPPMKLDDFLGLTDSAERLFVDFASSDRIKQAAEAKTGTAWGEAFAAARA